MDSQAQAQPLLLCLKFGLESALTVTWMLTFSPGPSYCDRQLGRIQVGYEIEESKITKKCKKTLGLWKYPPYTICLRKQTKHPPVKSI